MGQERLSGLILLLSECDLARNISYDAVIDSFASRCAQKARMQLIHLHQDVHKKLDYK